MRRPRPQVAVVGLGFSAVERRAATPLGALTCDAINQAVGDAGLRLSDIDGLATYPEPPFIGAERRPGIDTVPVDFVARHLRLGDISWSAEASSGMITASVCDAVGALVSGMCSRVVVWRALHSPREGYGVLRRQGDATGPAQFASPWRIVSPVQWHALAYRRYLDTYGRDRSEMAPLVVGFRDFAARWPHAYFRDRPLSIEEYLKGRIISDPLCLYDCDLPVQTCIAIVLTTADRATSSPWQAYLAAIATNTPSSPPKVHYTFDDYMESGARMARDLWSRSALGPADMSAAQLYDGFSPSVIYWLEAAGFCPPGTAFDFIGEGHISAGGSLPVNTFGGSIGAGRTHGLAHIAEAALQAAHRAGSRQVPDADAVCAFVGSPMLNGGAVVFTGHNTPS